MLKINQEFRNLIPPLSPEERSSLEKNLKAYGCTDPIVIWSRGEVILDGHNRFEICERLGIPYKTIVLDDLEDEIEAKYWIFTRQFARRNLNAYQRAELATKLEPVFAELARKNQAKAALNTTAQKSESSLMQNSAKAKIEKIVTRDEVAKAAKVSHDTIAKVKEIEKNATEEIKQALRDGKTTIHKEHKKIKAEKKSKKEDKEPTPEELLKEQNKHISKILHKLAMIHSDIVHCRTAFGLSDENKTSVTDEISGILEMLRD